MNSVAVIADRLVGFGVWGLFLEDGHRGPMKIGYIGTEHIGRNPVLGHPFGIGMAFCAHLRRCQAEFSGGGIFDVVNAMTVDTGWYIRVVFIGQSRAMHACQVFCVYGTMALGAGLRNDSSGFRQGLAGLLIYPILDSMGSMTV